MKHKREANEFATLPMKEPRSYVRIWSCQVSEKHLLDNLYLTNIGIKKYNAEVATKKEHLCHWKDCHPISHADIISLRYKETIL